MCVLFWNQKAKKLLKKIFIEKNKAKQNSNQVLDAQSKQIRFLDRKSKTASVKQFFIEIFTPEKQC